MVQRTEGFNNKYDHFRHLRLVLSSGTPTYQPDAILPHDAPPHSALGPPCWRPGAMRPHA